VKFRGKIEKSHAEINMGCRYYIFIMKKASSDDIMKTDEI